MREVELQIEMILRCLWLLFLCGWLLVIFEILIN